MACPVDFEPMKERHGTFEEDADIPDSEWERFHRFWIIFFQQLFLECPTSFVPAGVRQTGHVKGLEKQYQSEG
jgi:hypothetical protein